MRTVICSQLSHGVLNRWKNIFNLELNVQRIHDVRQMDIQSAEPLEQERLHVGDKIPIWKFGRYKSPGTNHSPAELIKAGGEILRSVIHKLIYSVWKKQELQQQWKDSISVPVHKRRDKNVRNDFRGVWILSTAIKFYPLFLWPG
jgi:hypothetical protein